MGVLDRITGGVDLVEGVDTGTRVAFMAEQLEAATNTIDMLHESLADLALAREDRGWQMLSLSHQAVMSRAGLNQSAELCRVMVSANPLIKRGLALRHAYVWGGGVEIEPRDKENEDLLAVVEDFIDVNAASLFDAQAQEELERALGTDGNLFLAHFTKPSTGRVKVRSLPFTEIAEVITNPEDRDDPWYYLRRWTATEVSPTGSRETVNYEAYYPALSYRPRVRPKTIDDIEILWDAPVRHVSVNRLDGHDFGLGDAFASIDWARAYSDFLNDWARLMKALAKYAWRVTGENGRKARGAAAEVRKNNANTARVTAGNPRPGGEASTVVSAGSTLEAIPKSGATLDSESGRPLAAMVAAGLGLPVTQLLADPGQTGARAVAETLDKPTALEFKGRQRLWQRVYRDCITYRIHQAVKAPNGPLSGTIVRDEWDNEVVTLAGGDATIEITFGPIDEIDPKALLEAIAIADGLDLIPDEVIVRAALAAIPGVEDIDEIMRDLLDDDGNFIRPSTLAGDRAAQAARRGQDPVGVL